MRIFSRLVLILAMASAVCGKAADPDEEIRRLSHEATTGVSAGRRRVNIAVDSALLGTNVSEKVVVPSGSGVLTLEVGPAGVRASRPAETAGSDARWIPFVIMFMAGVYFLIQRNAKKNEEMEIVPSQTQNPFPPGGPLSENFSIVKVIGEGGMGVVYEAMDRSLNRKVAVKRMRDDLKNNLSDYDQFLKEAKTVASLHHPHIVDIHSIVTQGGETYLVFEFVEGRTVEALLQERGKLSLKEVKFIFQPVCQALEFAHGRKVIHRDLKPANVMITTQGFVKVMDFGISRQIKDPLAKREDGQAPFHLTSVVGTPSYMAPEAEYGVLYPQSDIYSMGVMAYQLLAGTVPFAPSIIPLSDLKRSCDYEPLSKRVAGLPKEVDSLIEKSLEPDPQKRLRTPREFWELLARLS